MFVIFGWDKKIKPIKAIAKSYCYKCYNDSSWNIYHETDWVSLFFIPLIPLFKKHHIVCSICGNRVPIDKIKIQEIERLDSLSQAQDQQDICQTIVSIVENSQLSDKTETQRNFIRVSKEIARERTQKIDCKRK